MKDENIKTDLRVGLEKESFILEYFRWISSLKIKYNGRVLYCLRIERLIKSILFSKSWIDSSSKSDLPPDFHNDRHHIMMEMMRIDDCSGRKHDPNSFTKTTNLIKRYFGEDYREILKDSYLHAIPDTSNDNNFNFKGYFRNFERVLTNHSKKVNGYRKNYPKCKTCVLFVCDESNAYYQQIDNSEKKIIHLCFCDKKFIEIIKQCEADYVVWFTIYKTILNDKNKIIRQPLACIYDVKHLRHPGIEFDHSKMIKVKY